MGNFNILPADIILDILTRLPTESVLKCKLVCKPWRNLVYHPCFSQMHLPHLSDPSKSTFICNEYRRLSYLEYNKNNHEYIIRRININTPFGKAYNVVGSCNGLICLTTCRDSKLGYCQLAYICNPITKEYVILPKYNRYRDFRTYHLYDGFGYLRETNEYKVVRIDQLRRKPDLDCLEVYTLGSGSEWRNIGDGGFSSSMGYFTNSQGVFVSDSLYWITSTGNIVCFNLANEKFCKIPDVPCLSSGTCFRIGVSDGVLWCSNISTYDAKTTTWLLKKNGSQNMMQQEEYLSLDWGKDLVVNMKPLALTKSSEVLCYDSNNLYCYDIKSSWSKRLVSFPGYAYQIIPHMNTLISLKALGEEDTKTME